MSGYVDFHYMPLEGKITGEQVLKQTEDAINDLGEHVYELDIDESRIDEAVEKSEQAIETADAALSAVTTDRAVWKNTVAEMKATDIDLGVTAATRGEMVFNDGNGAFYGVRSEKSGDVDSDDTVFLNNGNVAERIQSMNIIAKGNNIIFVANVAELIDSDALIGNVYGTTGYYSANDGGAGLYSIRTKTQSDVEDGGSIIFLDNGNVAELITNGVVNVKQFGAVGDGVTDDTAAIQNAADALKNGSVLLFPASKLGSTTYYVTQSITISAGNVTVKSDSYGEYVTAVYTDKVIDIFTVATQGAVFENILLRGDGTTTTWGKPNGIVFSRSSSDIDARINNVGFLRLLDAVTITGKNMRVTNCMFSQCKNGIKINVYGSDDCRGFEIINNRFHSMGIVYNLLKSEVDSYPTTLEGTDSWCIHTPISAKFYDCIVQNNHVDQSYSGFYRGCISGTTIQGNVLMNSSPFLVYCDNADNISLNGSSVIVTGNLIMGNAFGNEDRAGYMLYQYFIYIDHQHNCLVEGNYCSNCLHEGFMIKNSSRSKVIGNVIMSAQRIGGTPATRYAIYADTVLQFYLADNMIDTAANVYSTAIKITSTDAFTTVGTNIIRNATVAYDIPAKTNIATGMLKSHTEWVLPSTPLSSGYTLNASSRGYCKLLNGKVVIDVTLGDGSSGNVAFNLPDGFRPSKNLIFSVPLFGDNAYVTVSSNGNVFVTTESGTNTGKTFPIYVEFIQ